MRPQIVPLVVALFVAPSLGCPPEPRSADDLGATCPEGASWDGARCVARDVACPSGSSWDGERCIATQKSAPDPLVGGWSVAGARAGGAAYAGDAAFTRAGEAYAVVWAIGGASYKGIAVRRGDVVSVGWSDADDHGVVAYEAKGDGALRGLWFDARGGKPGRETLTGGLPNLAGVYSIGEGITPEGGSYTGSCDLVVTGELHTLVWRVGKETYRGLGIRSGSVLSVGFSTAPSGNFGVVQYTLSENQLHGRWAEWSQKTPELGVETLTKK